MVIIGTRPHQAQHTAVALDGNGQELGFDVSSTSLWALPTSLAGPSSLPSAAGPLKGPAGVLHSPWAAISTSTAPAFMLSIWP